MDAQVAAEQCPKLTGARQPNGLGWLWPWLLPGVFLLLHAIFVHARGPFYLGPNLDPEYAYLCNSLNLATGHKPRHVDHPGTTLQLLGAAVIHATHPLASSEEKVIVVLNEPERHLQWINFALAGSYAAALALIGIVLWRQTGQWLAPLLLQAAPFLLGDQFRAVARVSAEPMLLIVGTVMAAWLYLASREEPAARASRARLAGTLALPLLAATGTVTKLSFFPMALVPLAVLRSWKERAIYVLGTGAFTYLWLLPAGGMSSRLTSWIKGLAFREGRYGRGEAGMLPPEYFTNLVRLVTENHWLVLAVATSWIAVFFGWARRKRLSSQARRWHLLLGGVALGQTLQMLMVAKYAEWRYLVPALMFCPLNLLLLLELSRPWWPARRWLRVPPACALVLGSTLALRAHYLDLSQRSAARLEVARALQTDFGDQPTVYSYGASSPYLALWFGNFWSGDRYTQVLARQFAQLRAPAYVANHQSGELSSMGRPSSSISQIGAMHRSFLLVGGAGACSRLLTRLPPQVSTEELLVRNNETIMRVTFPEAGAE